MYLRSALGKTFPCVFTGFVVRPSEKALTSIELSANPWIITNLPLKSSFICCSEIGVVSLLSYITGLLILLDFFLIVLGFVFVSVSSGSEKISSQFESLCSSLKSL